MNGGLTAQCCEFTASPVCLLFVHGASNKNNVWLLKVLKKGFLVPRICLPADECGGEGEGGKLGFIYFQGWKFNAGNPNHILFLIKTLISVTELAQTPPKKKNKRAHTHKKKTQPKNQNDKR